MWTEPQHTRLCKLLRDRIDEAVDPSPFGAFPVEPDHGGHDSRFRCEAARAWLGALGFAGEDLGGFLEAFTRSDALVTRRHRLVAHNLAAAWAIDQGDFQKGLHHATTGFSHWQHDIYNHRLVLVCKAATGTAAAGYDQHLAAYLDRSYCTRPFEHFETTSDNRVYLCSPDYLTPPAADLGPLLDGGVEPGPGSVDEHAWNTPAARCIRRSIIAGEFAYCSPLTCPRIQSRTLEQRRLDGLPGHLDPASPQLVQEDYLGWAIYYFGSRVYAVPAGKPLAAGNLADEVRVSYSVEDLEDQLGGLPEPIDRTWFARNGLPASVVLGRGARGPDQGRIQERMALAPTELMMTHDDSCNISCPSCRTRTVIATPAQTEKFDRLVPIFLGLLRNAKTLIMSGSGDPFASRHYRRLLRAIGHKDDSAFGPVAYPPDFRINLMTNGLLFTRETYEELGLRGLIGIIALSMDACEKDAFERIRRGSRWEDLIGALHFIQTIRHENDRLLLISYFTVQAGNFRQIPAFVEFCRKYRFRSVQLNMIRNFGAYALEDFERENIGDPAHPEFQAFLDVMRSPVLADGYVALGNAQDYRDLALQERP